MISRKLGLISLQNRPIPYSTGSSYSRGPHYRDFHSDDAYVEGGNVIKSKEEKPAWLGKLTVCRFFYRILLILIHVPVLMGLLERLPLNVVFAH